MSTEVKCLCWPKGGTQTSCAFYPCAPTALTSARIEHTKALEAAATPGPWVTTPPNSNSGWLGNYWSIGTDVDGLLERFTGDSGGALDNTQADAEFIAHARTAVPALVAEVERLRAHIAAIEAVRGNNHPDTLEMS